MSNSPLTSSICAMTLSRAKQGMQHCFLPSPDNLFFSTDAPPQEEEIRERFQQTFARLFHYPHPLIVAAIGKQRFLEGTAMIVEGLQCRELNKHLFFKLLDIILLELFPELGGGLEVGKGSSSSL